MVACHRPRWRGTDGKPLGRHRVAARLYEDFEHVAALHKVNNLTMPSRRFRHHGSLTTSDDALQLAIRSCPSVRTGPWPGSARCWPLSRRLASPRKNSRMIEVRLRQERTLPSDRGEFDASLDVLVGDLRGGPAVRRNDRLRPVRPVRAQPRRHDSAACRDSSLRPTSA